MPAGLSGRSRHQTRHPSGSSSCRSPGGCLEARASGRNILVGRREMKRVGRAKEFGETRGFMKALVDADTKEILGAAILGLHGDEAVHCILDVMYARKPYTTISRAVRRFSAAPG